MVDLVDLFDLVVIHNLPDPIHVQPRLGDSQPSASLPF